MDRDRFTGPARTRALASTRRALVRLAAALGIAEGLAATTLTSLPTEAKKRKNKNKKKCKGGTTKCGKGCVNTQTDARHCGGCNQPCPAGIPCLNGACQDNATCTPECPTGRDCFQGSCTCVANGECEGRQDPAGDWCVTPPGHTNVTVCGCPEGYEVCDAGEKCSNCCTDTECAAANPGAEGIICASVAPNFYLPRRCCLSNGAPCGNSDHCCSLKCDQSHSHVGACVCRQQGETCGFSQSCCSGGCDPTTRTCT